MAEQSNIVAMGQRIRRKDKKAGAFFSVTRFGSHLLDRFLFFEANCPPALLLFLCVLVEL